MSNNVLVHRASIADGLKALARSQQRLSGLLKEDSYTAGYSAGFEDALMAVAELVGVGPELQPGCETITPAATVKTHHAIP